MNFSLLLSESKIVSSGDFFNSVFKNNYGRDKKRCKTLMILITLLHHVNTTVLDQSMHTKIRKWKKYT